MGEKYPATSKKVQVPRKITLDPVEPMDLNKQIKQSAKFRINDLKIHIGFTNFKAVRKHH